MPVILASHGPSSSCGPGSGAGGGGCEVRDLGFSGVWWRLPDVASLLAPFMWACVFFWMTKFADLGIVFPNDLKLRAHTGGSGRGIRFGRDGAAGDSVLAIGTSLYLGIRSPLTSPGGGRGSLCSSSRGLRSLSPNFRLAGVPARSGSMAMFSGAAVGLCSRSAPSASDATRVLGLTDRLPSRS